MIEGCFSPTRRRVAAIAGFTELAIVRVVAAVTVNTGGMGIPMERAR